MSSSINRLAKDIYTVFSKSEDKKPKPYDTQAKVTKVEGDTAYVRIPGSESDTPVRKTIEVKEGDNIQARLSGGRAWITGNDTAPPTDDRMAIQAGSTAEMAAQASKQAWDYAKEAKGAAETAYRAAESAQASAERAEQKADEAVQSATVANRAANDALTQLSTVENVIDTLEWIQEHGEYQITADTSVVEGKIYYTLSGTAISTPVGSPVRNGYYEQVTVDEKTYFVKSTDTAVDSTKTYYNVVPQAILQPTGNPNENLYYDLLIDEAISNYVASHLALTDDGLWILTDGTPDTPAAKVLISSVAGREGVTIYGSNGQTLAHYGDSAIIGDAAGYNIRIETDATNGRISFCKGNDAVAYVSTDQLYISKTVVLNEMQVGRGADNSIKWSWAYDATDESIYLKWIGD